MAREYRIEMNYDDEWQTVTPAMVASNEREALERAIRQGIDIGWVLPPGTRFRVGVNRDRTNIIVKRWSYFRPHKNSTRRWIRDLPTALSAYGLSS